MTTRKLASKAKEFLAELRTNAQFQEQQKVLDLLFDALLFIDSSGQLHIFEDFREYLASEDPPRVMASFDTREEAETWLKEAPEPPSSAYVLIADRYHQLVYNRELNHRALIPHPVLEYFLGARVREGLPRPVASFTTHQEAETWFRDETAPGKQTVILIGGEPHLAIYHPNIQHRSIYPLSMGIEVDVDER